MTYFRLSEWKRRASIDSDHPAPLSSQPCCLLLPQRPWLRPEAVCAHSCGDDCHVEFLGASRKQCRDRHHRITAGETLTGAWRGGERVGRGHPSSHHGREGHRLHCSGCPRQPWGALEEMAAYMPPELQSACHSASCPQSLPGLIHSLRTHAAPSGLKGIALRTGFLTQFLLPKRMQEIDFGFPPVCV